MICRVNKKHIKKNEKKNYTKVKLIKETEKNNAHLGQSGMGVCKNDT